MWGFNGVPMCRDMYEYFSLGKKNLGPFGFIMFTAAMVEVLIGLKAHHHSHFNEVMPW